VPLDVFGEIERRIGIGGLDAFGGVDQLLELFVGAVLGGKRCESMARPTRASGGATRA
jgi:hypothetical protein